MSAGGGRSGYVILCAALLAAVVGTAAWSFAHVKSRADHRLVGVRWTLVALRSDRPVPLDRPGAELTFGKGGHLTASDGVNFMTGDYSSAGGRLTMSVNTATAAGTAGFSPVVAAMESLYMHPTSSGDRLSSAGGATSIYSIGGSRLVITTSGWTLTFSAATS